MKEFLILCTGFPRIDLITSIPMAPTIIAVVVARAGIILPAIILT
jgi:hypothetical protein